MPAFLLAMQAAGMITDWFATKQQVELGRAGAKIEQAGINANIEMTRAQAEDASLMSMQKLRQTLGSQIAVQAARGTASGAGSAFSLYNNSIGNFNEDKHARNLNLLSREAELKGQGVMSFLKQQSSENQAWAGFRSRTFNTLGGSSMFGPQGGANSAGPGMTSI